MKNDKVIKCYLEQKVISQRFISVNTCQTVWQDTIEYTDGSVETVTKTVNEIIYPPEVKAYFEDLGG